MSTSNWRTLCSGMLTPQEQQSVFESVVRTFENRAYGNNYSSDSTTDNLELLEAVMPDYVELRVSGGQRQFPYRQLFIDKYFPRIRKLHFRFYAIDHFVKYHKTFAAKFPTTTGEIVLDGTLDDPEKRGKHEGCRRIGGGMRGCDVCEMVHALNRQLPATHGSRSVEDMIEEKNGAVFVLSINGAEVNVTGTMHERVVTAMTISGYLQLLGLSSGNTVGSLSDVDDNSNGKVVDRKAVGGTAVDSASKGSGKQNLQLACMHEMRRVDYKHHMENGVCWEECIA